MIPAKAEAIARDALLWLCAEEHALVRFLDATGLDSGDLRALAADPAGLGALLDFLLGDETLLLRFAAEAEIDPALPARARAALPGGEAIHWT